MSFFNRSILIKFFVSFAIFTLLLGGAFWAMKYFSVDSVSTEVLFIFVGILLLYVLVTFFFFVIRPLRAVLYQMQMVLSGQRFKKVFTKRVDEVGVMAHFFNQVTEGLTRAASDVKDRKRILDELAVATELQNEIFPEEMPKIEGLEIIATNRPATEIGGDSYDVIDSKDKTYIYVGDVTGHGVTAGLIMAMVNSMITSFAEVYSTTLDIILHTNKNIKKYVKPSMYMTLVMLCWDKVNKKLTYVGAGHEHILVYRKATGQIDDFVSGGTALGMVEDVSKTAQEKEISLQVGDMVIIYSDGITEAKNAVGELFELEGLKNSIIEHAAEYSAKGVSYRVSKDLAAFVGDESQLDDMTLLIAEKT